MKIRSSNSQLAINTSGVEEYEVKELQRDEDGSEGNRVADRGVGL